MQTKADIAKRSIRYFALNGNFVSINSIKEGITKTNCQLDPNIPITPFPDLKYTKITFVSEEQALRFRGLSNNCFSVSFNSPMKNAVKIEFTTFPSSPHLIYHFLCNNFNAIIGLVPAIRDNIFNVTVDFNSADALLSFTTSCSSKILNFDVKVSRIQPFESREERNARTLVIPKAVKKSKAFIETTYANVISSCDEVPHKTNPNNYSSYYIHFKTATIAQQYANQCIQINDIEMTKALPYRPAQNAPLIYQIKSIPPPQRTIEQKVSILESHNREQDKQLCALQVDVSQKVESLNNAFKQVKKELDEYKAKNNEEMDALNDAIAAIEKSLLIRKNKVSAESKIVEQMTM